MIKMKTVNNKFIQLQVNTIAAAICFGLPYIRRMIKENEELETDSNIASKNYIHIFCIIKSLVLKN